VSLPPADDLGSVAIVHDYLNQRGGAERVVLELAEIWPDAPIYTSLFRPQSTFPEFSDREVRTSPLDQLPVDQAFRNLFPLYPAAFRALGTLDADVVVTSSSGWAHSVRTAPGTFHAVYCHTPARWLYGGEYDNASARRLALVPLQRPLRRWDRGAARRADLYVANSRLVSERIRDSYGIDAPVIHPPVDVERFTPRPRGERLLVVSRLLPYKHVGLIVRAATYSGIGLDVVGTGPTLDALRRAAGPTVTFHGRLPDEAVTELMEGCRALCVAATEDFGITPVEANAAGKPVVAFAAGGALETLEDGVNAALFDRRTPAAVLDAIHRCDALDASPEEIAAGARRFSRDTFRSRFADLVHSRAERLAA
jgi:glycosyltransferase involved in cell wall biosynthesis